MSHVQIDNVDSHHSCDDVSAVCKVLTWIKLRGVIW